MRHVIAEDFCLDMLLKPVPRLLSNRQRVLVISGGDPDQMARYHLLCAQGVKVVVLNAPDHWVKDCLDSGLIDDFIPVNLAARESLFDDVVAAIMDSGLMFDQVIAFSPSATPLAARLSYAMGLTDHFDLS